MASTTIPSPTSGSEVIQANLLALSNYAVLIPGEIWAYTLATSPWPNLLPRGEFKKGMGARQRAMHFDRALAGTTGALTWANHGALGNSSAATGNTPPDISVGGRSLPPVTVIQATQKVDEWGLKWGAWETPQFDVRDAVFNYNYLEQFGQYYMQCQKAAAYSWEEEMREFYFRMCDHKVILGVPESGTPTNPYGDLAVVAPQSLSGMVGYTAAQLNMTGNLPSNGVSAAHSVLTNGVLQDIRAKLSRSAAGNDSRIQENFPLVSSPEQQFYLLHEPGLRSDLRWTDGAPLLKALGPSYTKSFLGYNMIPDMYAPRFTLALNGATYDFTRVMPLTYQAGNLSTAISSAATYDSGNATILTVGTTVGINANNAVRITPSSASDESYSDEFTVLAVPSSTTLVINKAFTSTATGTLYLISNGESGFIENSSYDTAPYEGSFIVFPSVCEVQMISYPTTLGQGSTFESQPMPMGTAKWINFVNPDWNPDGTIGYFRGIFEYAGKPKMTQFGWFIMHRRAAPVTLASPSFAVTQGLGWFS